MFSLFLKIWRPITIHPVYIKKNRPSVVLRYYSSWQYCSKASQPLYSEVGSTLLPSIVSASSNFRLIYSTLLKHNKYRYLYKWSACQLGTCDLFTIKFFIGVCNKFSPAAALRKKIKIEWKTFLIRQIFYTFVVRACVLSTRAIHRRISWEGGGI